MYLIYLWLCVPYVDNLDQVFETAGWCVYGVLEIGSLNESHWIRKIILHIKLASDHDLNLITTHYERLTSRVGQECHYNLIHMNQLPQPIDLILGGPQHSMHLDLLRSNLMPRLSST